MPGRRKVLFIASAYPRHAGDVITPWLGQTIARLRDAGVDVSVLAPAFRGGADHVVDGVTVHRFRYAPPSWETLSHDHPIPWQISQRPARAALVPGYLAACAAAATRLARSGEVDVLHAFWPLPHALPAIVARRLTGIPLVSTFFGAELHWLAARSAVARAAVRAIVRQSDAVTAISAYTARELQRYAPAAQPAIVPFGAAVAPRGDAPPRPPFSGTEARFLFVGRLTARKGVDVLLRALALLEAPATLHVVGDGAERATLAALARELGVAGRVTFTGYVPDDDLRDEIDAADALVLPALADAVAGPEGLGVVLIEAMGRGRPVIASDVGGIPDVVVHERTGVLVPPADPVALASAMRALMREPARAAALAAAGRAHVLRAFGWERIVGQLSALYESVVGPGRR